MVDANLVCQTCINEVSWSFWSLSDMISYQFWSILREYCWNYIGSKNCPNDRVFYFACCYVNSNPNYITLGLFQSYDVILSHILFLDYYVIFLICSTSIFAKHPNIGTVFWPTVSHEAMSQHMVVMRQCASESWYSRYPQGSTISVIVQLANTKWSNVYVMTCICKEKWSGCSYT